MTDIPDKAAGEALRAFDALMGYSKLERLRAAIAAARPHMGGEPVAWLDPSGGIKSVILAHHKAAPMLPKAQARYSVPLYRGAPPASPDVAALIEALRSLSMLVLQSRLYSSDMDVRDAVDAGLSLSRLSQPGGRDE